MRRVFFSVFLFLTSASVVFSQQQVLVISITGEVDPAMASYVGREVKAAEESHSIILLHINTFGGRLDVATRIRDLIINAKVPQTIAFIDKRAISAGALIALSAKMIVMSPGSTFGAATPIHETGEKASEKVVSYMRAEMRSTAEMHHRNPDVAAAMVDEELGLDSASGTPLSKGSLLTLTNESAKKAGYIDYEATSIQQALEVCGVKNATVNQSEQTFSDEIIRLLTLPMVSSILILIGLSGIFYTIKTGHFGWITISSLVSLLLFFSAQYITEIAPIIALILFLTGIFLLLIEFLTPVPSFGTAAILGIAGIFLGLFLALAGDLRALTPERLETTTGTLAIALIGLVGAIFLIFRYAPGWPGLKKFVNQTVLSTTTIPEHRTALLGKTGSAITPLRPAGTALIDNKRVDVVTSGEFVLAGTPIEVVQIVSSKIVVKPV